MAEKTLEISLGIKKSSGAESEVKKVQDLLDKMRDSMKKTAEFSEKFARAAGGGKALSGIKELQREIKIFHDLIGKIGKEPGFVGVSDSAIKARQHIGELVKSFQKVKEEASGLSGAAVDEFKNLSSATGISIQVLNQFVAEVNKTSGSMSLLFSQLSRATSSSLLFADAFNRIKVSQTELIQVTNSLTQRLRELQVVSALKGISMFEENIKGVRIFRDEIEKLALSLAKLSGQGIYGSEGGASRKMIEEFNRLQNVIKDVARQQQALNSIFKKLGEAEKDINRAGKALILLDKTGKEVSATVGNLAKSTIQIGEKSEAGAKKAASAWRELYASLKFLMREVGVNLSSLPAYAKALEEKVTQALTKISDGLVKAGATQENLKNLMITANEQIKTSVSSMAQASLRAWSSDDQVMKAQVTAYEELSGRITKLQNDYNLLIAAYDKGDPVLKKLVVEQGILNRVLTESGALFTLFGEKAGSAFRRINDTARAMQQGAVSISFVGQEMKTLGTTVKNLEERMKVLNEISKYTGKSQDILSQKLDIARQKTSAYTQTIERLVVEMNRLKARGEAAGVRELEAQLAKLGIASRIAQTNMRGINEELGNLTRSSADSNRAMDRLRSDGFANMIISQAAWMAGFQVVFGTLERFKSALSSVVELQDAVSRAMRTGRSEVLSAAEIYKGFTDAIVNTKLKTGAAIKDIGEMLFQLSSSGLEAEESMAALQVTMANVVSTEADAAAITKLVAGLYNNFSDQIVKLDGRMATITNTFSNANGQIVETASLMEKFTHINDLMVAGFRDNQMEMNELKDGMKYMAQSAKLANISLTEQIGILGFLHNHLIKAGMSGRAIRVILSRITKEAELFSKAFKVDIDLSKPLEFMKILEDINVSMKRNAMSVAEMGDLFVRMGLRGAEPFALLITKVDELKDTISVLEREAAGATQAMLDIRLDNLGKQSELASDKVEALLRKGLQPLGEILASLVSAFNLAGKAIIAFNEATGGVLSFFVKVVGYIGLAAAALFAWNNAIGVLKWLYAVIVTLILRMKDFAATTLETSAAMNTMTAATARLATAQTGFAAATAAAGGSALILPASLQKTSAEMEKTKVASAGLMATLVSLKGMIISLGITLAIIYGMKLIDYLVNWRQRSIEVEKKMLALATSSNAVASEIENVLTSIENLNRVTDQNKEAVDKAARAAGIYTSGLEELNNRLPEIKDRLSEMKGEAEETAKVLMAIKLSEQFKQTEADIRDAELALNRLNFLLDETGDVFVEGFGIARTSLEGYQTELGNAHGALTKVNEDLRQHAQAGKAAEEQGGALLVAWNDHAEALSRVKRSLEESIAETLEKIEVMNKEADSTKDVVSQGEKYQELLKRLTVGLKEESEEYEEVITKQNQKITSMNKLMNDTKKYAEQHGELTKAFKENTKEVENFIASLEPLSEILTGTSAVGKIEIDELGKVFRSGSDDANLFANALWKVESETKRLAAEGSLKTIGGSVLELLVRFKELKASADSGLLLGFLNDIEKTEKEGIALLNSLKASLIDFAKKIKDVSEIAKLKFELDLRVKTDQIDLAKERVDYLKKAWDDARAANEKSWETEQAYHKWRREIEELIKKEKERQKTITDGIEKDKAAIDELRRKLNESNLTEEERIRVQEEILKKQEEMKAKAEEVAQGIKKIYDLEKQWLEERNKALGLSDEANKRRMDNLFNEYQRATAGALASVREIEAEIIKTNQKISEAAEGAVKEIAKTIESVLALLKLLGEPKEVAVTLNEEALNAAINKATELLKGIEASWKVTVDLEEFTANIQEAKATVERMTKELDSKIEVALELIELDEEKAKIDAALTEIEAKIKEASDQMKTTIEFDADSARVFSVINETVQGIKDLKADLPVGADTSKIYEAMSDVTAAINKMKAMMITSSDISDALKKAEGARQTIEKMKASIKIAVEANTEKVKAAVDKLNSDIKKTEKKPVDDSSIKAAILRARELNSELSKPITKTVRIIEQKSHGGPIYKMASGGRVPVMVTAGEGYVPPSIAARNLDALNTLNGGHRSPHVPSFISKFHGPGGIDKIPALLPPGSFVLSKKGMEAYESSVSMGAKKFQKGGQVGVAEEDNLVLGSEGGGGSFSETDMGSITIIVQKENRREEFRVFGETSVLSSLRKELETERLTRLH